MFLQKKNQAEQPSHLHQPICKLLRNFLNMQPIHLSKHATSAVYHSLALIFRFTCMLLIVVEAHNLFFYKKKTKRSSHPICISQYANYSVNMQPTPPSAHANKPMTVCVLQRHPHTRIKSRYQTSLKKQISLQNASLCCH
jgi:hypothetical protein